ncbi:MAG: acetate/propionate family kinase [Alphaproteobacteria bacterium]|nr:acetate/propionate family kinase [Alphaproteobacteria bacterium]
MHILTLNAGSSSLKFSIYAAKDTRLMLSGSVTFQNGAHVLKSGSTLITLPQHKDVYETLAFVFDWLEKLGFSARLTCGIGHRIVHGGRIFTQPVVLDQHTIAQLEGLKRLAPLHVPISLDVIAAAKALRPQVLNVGCFDTAFHADQPEVASQFALPQTITAQGYRRYGFHGLNYEHIVSSFAEVTGQLLPRRLLAAHLGSGASLCAIVGGKSVATTMGFSTADGLTMSSRTGSLDPGVMLALMRDQKLGVDEMEALLYRRSGLLGLSGLSADMQTLLASTTAEATFAVAHYCYWAARHAGSLIMAMGGVDAVVFSGGVGENSSAIRHGILAHMTWLNLADNQVYVIKADEERVLARHVSKQLASHC